jgi:HEPN domain-containing protein
MEKSSMVHKKLIKEWLEKADEDYGFASSVIEDSPYYVQICFHYQQAAEKYLKAFIVAHELVFKKSHELLELLSICVEKEKRLSEIEDDCNYLNRFYIDTRYPVHWPANYTKEDALKAKSAANRIAETVKEMLGKEGYV